MSLICRRRWTRCWAPSCCRRGTCAPSVPAASGHPASTWYAPLLLCRAGLPVLQQFLCLTPVLPVIDPVRPLLLPLCQPATSASPLHAVPPTASRDKLAPAALLICSCHAPVTLPPSAHRGAALAAPLWHPAAPPMAAHPSAPTARAAASAPSCSSRRRCGLLPASTRAPSSMPRSTHRTPTRSRRRAACGGSRCRGRHRRRPSRRRPTPAAAHLAARRMACLRLHPPCPPSGEA
jgi:hypothetical protein